MYIKNLLPLAAFANSAMATGILTITNKCRETVYIVASNPTYQSATLALVQGNDFQIGITGSGASVGASKDPNFYSKAVAKQIFGYSVNTGDGLVYYSVTNDYGNPFAGESFALTSSNAGCTAVRSANGVTYACAASSSLDYTFCG